MVRNVLGSLIALAGAAAAVWSPFRPWYDGRHGSDVRIEDLFNGVTHNSAALFGSVLLPMAFAALLTLIGVALRSRGLVALAGLVVLGFTILWMVRQGQAASELTAGARGLGVGVANALGGGALLLLGALIMRGRPSRVYGSDYDDRPYDDGRYGRYPHDERYDERYDEHGPYAPTRPTPRGRPNRGTRDAPGPRSGIRSRTRPAPPPPPDPRPAPAAPEAARTGRGRTPPPLPCRSPRPHHRPRSNRNSNSGRRHNNSRSNRPRSSHNNSGRRPLLRRRPGPAISSRPHPRWSGAGNTVSRAPPRPNSPNSPSRPNSPIGVNARRRNGSRPTGRYGTGRCRTATQPVP
ncbi:hypothetical protein [Streptomyces sp. RPA4-5]|uniref:hypothetical protein n=1 Tax=Streptomyces sp. RPA4-5 TaxID=2721245 RepID=UPI0032B54978